MTIKYIPFESRTGFKSPGFEVTPTGDVIAKSLDVVEDVNINSLTVNGVQFLQIDDSTISLGDSILNSSLTRVGTLEYLNIEGDLVITQDSSWTVSVVNGKVTVISGPETGVVENVDIGQTTPGLGSFTDLTASTLAVDGNTTIGGTLDVNDNVSVDGDTTITGTVSVTGNITITNQPTEIYHATRKDYVDKRISAFSIAFGA